MLFGEKVASENFYFSLKAGANFSDLSNAQDGAEMHIGFNFGLLATIKVNEKLFIIPEFSPLSPKGVKDFPLSTSGNEDLDALLPDSRSGPWELYYIDIPVVVKYYPHKKFNIGAGPYLSILTGANNKFLSTIDGKDLLVEEDFKSELNTIDAGMVFELGVSLWEARKGKGLNIHARYVLGMMDIVKDNDGDTVKNSLFQVFVSFPFIGE